MHWKLCYNFDSLVIAYKVECGMIHTGRLKLAFTALIYFDIKVQLDLMGLIFLPYVCIWYEIRLSCMSIVKATQYLHKCACMWYVGVNLVLVLCGKAYSLEFNFCKQSLLERSYWQYKSYQVLQFNLGVKLEMGSPSAETSLGIPNYSNWLLCSQFLTHSTVGAHSSWITRSHF